MLCGTWGTHGACTCSYIDQVIGLREGAKTYACMNALILPGPPGDPGRHPRQLRPDAPSSSPRSRSWRPRRCCASASSPRRRCCRTRNFGTSNQPSAREDARGAGAAAARRRPGSRSTARCTATPRSTATTAHEIMPRQPADRRGQPAGPAQHRRRQHLVQPAQDRGRRRHRDRPGAARRGASRCTSSRRRRRCAGSST